MRRSLAGALVLLAVIVGGCARHRAPTLDCAHVQSVLQALPPGQDDPCTESQLVLAYEALEPFDGPLPVRDELRVRLPLDEAGPLLRLPPVPTRIRVFFDGANAGAVEAMVHRAGKVEGANGRQVVLVDAPGISAAQFAASAGEPVMLPTPANGCAKLVLVPDLRCAWAGHW